MKSEIGKHHPKSPPEGKITDSVQGEKVIAYNIILTAFRNNYNYKRNSVVCLNVPFFNQIHPKQRTEQPDAAEILTISLFLEFLQYYTV